jgi:hypothetical protein
MYTVDSHYLTLMLNHGSYRQVFDPAGYQIVFTDGERFAVWYREERKAA